MAQHLRLIDTRPQIEHEHWLLAALFPAACVAAGFVMGAASALWILAGSL